MLTKSNAYTLSEIKSDPEISSYSCKILNRSLRNQPPKCLPNTYSVIAKSFIIAWNNGKSPKSKPLQCWIGLYPAILLTKKLSNIYMKNSAEISMTVVKKRNGVSIERKSTRYNHRKSHHICHTHKIEYTNAKSNLSDGKP